MVSKEFLRAQTNVPESHVDSMILRNEYSSNQVANRPTSLLMMQNHGKIEGDSGYMSYSGGFHTTGKWII